MPWLRGQMTGFRPARGGVCLLRCVDELARAVSGAREVRSRPIGATSPAPGGGPHRAVSDHGLLFHAELAADLLDLSGDRRGIGSVAGEDRRRPEARARGCGPGRRRLLGGPSDRRGCGDRRRAASERAGAGAPIRGKRKSSRQDELQTGQSTYFQRLTDYIRSSSVLDVAERTLRCNRV